MRTLAFLSVLVAVLATPARADYTWDYHPDPDVCHLGEITYAIDGVRREGYRFGGIGFGAVSNEFKRQALDDSTLKWQVVSQSGSPPARRRAQSFFDARRDRFLFLGGIGPDAVGHGDVWAWDRASGNWSELTVTGVGPDSVTLDFPMTYDGRNDRLIYVNNAAASSHPMIWRLDLSTDPPSWTSLQLPAPFSLNAGASAAYDSLGDRLFLQATYSYPASGLYVVNFSSPTGFEPVPAKNYFTFAPRLAVDPVHNRLLVDVDSGDELFSLVTYDLGTLDSTEVPVEFLSLDRRPLKGQALAWAVDPVTGAIEVPMMDDQMREARATLVPDDNAHWVRHQESERPAASRAMAGAIDPVGRSLYLFGGMVSHQLHFNGSTIWYWDDRVTNEVYRLDLDDLAHHEHLHPTGVGPGPLLDATAVYDSVGHRLVFYGGHSGVNGGDHNELWALQLEPALHWSQIATTNTGPNRRFAGMAIDPATRRIYLVGGYNPNAQVQPGFLWSLDLDQEPATWTLVRLTGPDIFDASTGFDGLHQRILGAGAQGAFTIDAADTTIPVTVFDYGSNGNSFYYRSGISGALDVRRNAFFVHGGRSPFAGHTGQGLLFGTGVWTGETFKDNLAPVSDVPPPNRDALVAYDSKLDRLVMVNGYRSTGYYCRLCDPVDTGDRPMFGVWTLQLDDAVPALVDLAGVALEPRGVRVRFSGAGAEGPLRVERAIDGTSEWTWIGDAREISPGLYEWIDETVVPGTAYRYRARYTSDGAERATAVSDAVLVPGSVEFALRAPGGAVGGGWPVVLEGHVFAGENARVELVDVAGRVVSRRAVTGAFRASIAPLRPSAGIYFARLVQGERSVTIKLVRF